MSKKIEAGQSDDREMDNALESMETRWKYAVFPAMIAFVILAGFGFYLIYGMLQRMEDIAKDIDKISKVMVESLPVMEGGVVGMSSRMQWIGEDLKGMRADVHQLSLTIQQTMPEMEGKVGDMSKNIGNMTHATSSMATTTQNMGQNLWNMNRNFSKPLSMMRKMIPWGGDKTPPPPAMPSYNNPYYSQPSAATAVPVLQAPVNVVTSTPVAAVTSAPDVQAETVLDAGMEKGKQKFINLCASCHGTNAGGGVGPSLVEHTAEQIETIFEQYRTGVRSGTMTGIVKDFTTKDVSNIAKFLESYNKPAGNVVTQQ